MTRQSALGRSPEENEGSNPSFATNVFSTLALPWLGTEAKEATKMLSWAVTFLVIALIAALFGFSGIAGTSTNIAWILFVVFLIVAAISFVTGRSRVL